jgi:hypothetical protein
MIFSNSHCELKGTVTDNPIGLHYYCYIYTNSRYTFNNQPPYGNGIILKSALVQRGGQLFLPFLYEKGNPVMRACGRTVTFLSNMSSTRVCGRTVEYLIPLSYF